MSSRLLQQNSSHNHVRPNISYFLKWKNKKLKQLAHDAGSNFIWPSSSISIHLISTDHVDFVSHNFWWFLKKKYFIHLPTTLDMNHRHLNWPTGKKKLTTEKIYAWYREEKKAVWKSSENFFPRLPAVEFQHIISKLKIFYYQHKITHNQNIGYACAIGRVHTAYHMLM